MKNYQNNIPNYQPLNADNLLREFLFRRGLYRFLCLGLICVIGSAVSIAQCPDVSTLRLNSQQEVNDFAANYPNCTVLNSTLFIDGDDISDLTPLNNLTRIEQRLFIWDNPSLTNLDGLSSLGHVEISLSIKYNDLLTNIDGLSGLTGVAEYISIENNNLLINLDGLSSLREIGSYLTIEYNQSLINIDGLLGLTSIGGRLGVVGNEALEGLNGLSNITGIGGTITMVGNSALRNIAGLSSITHIDGGLIITRNPLIENLDGLSTLTQVGTSRSHRVNISQNDLLVNIDGLSGLTELPGSMVVFNNPLLTNLDGLSGLTELGGSLQVEENFSLTNMDGLCPLFNAGFSETFLQEDNGTTFNIDNCPCITIESDITLSTQQEVNGFYANFEGCMVLDGDLTIEGADIMDLSPLRNLTKVEGYFVIKNNPSLQNLTGLETITQVGERLEISGNGALTDVDGLSSLTLVERYMIIQGNNSLTNLDGLSSLTQVKESFYIGENSSLSNLHGLSALTEVGGADLSDVDIFDPQSPSEGTFQIVRNAALVNLEGLSALTEVGERLKIEGNGSLINLNGLSVLRTIGSTLDILNNSSLENLDGLPSLTYIGGNLDILQNASLSSLNGLSALRHVESMLNIQDNSALESIDGFSSLSQVGADLHIYNNNALTSLGGLTALTEVGRRVFIRNNNSLIHIDGLASLTQIRRDLWIRDNTVLENIDGLSSLMEVMGEISIRRNASLTNMDGLCRLFKSGFSGSFTQTDNGVVFNVDDCPCAIINGDIVLASQQDVNDFGQWLTYCTILNGSLWINGSDIADLTPLQELIRVKGSLGIGNLTFNLNNSLSNLDGLSSLTQIDEDLVIEGNSSLRELDGLVSLTHVGGDFYLTSNNALENVSGLAALISVQNLFINNNASLVSLEGLSGITQVVSLHIIGNSLISSLDALSGLNQVDNLLIANNTAITNLDVFAALSSLRSLTISRQPLITDLDAFSFLTQIDGNLYIGDNISLTDLDAFSSLTYVGGNINIRNCPYLINMNGLCPLFNAGYSGNFSQEGNGVVFSPDDCACMIEHITVGNQGICDPLSNTYTQNIEITYDNAPISGHLNVNGQLFPIQSSPQTVTLENLVSDGQPVNITAFFTDDASCTKEILDLFTAPSDCSVPCEILSATAGDPYNCDPNSDTYQRDLTIEYLGTNLTGIFMVSVDGSEPMAYPVLSQSPQILTLTDLPSNGQWENIDIYISDENNCNWSATNFFQNPQSCGDNPSGDCDISALNVGEQRCDYDNGTYAQDLIISYSDAPTNGSILLKANNQSGWESFPITGNPQTLTLEGRTPGEGNVDIFVKFSDDNGCTFYADNLFSAPEACSQPASGDGIILFVVKDANSMHGGDAAVKTQLENTGYTVEVKSENVSQTNDANGKALVLISNTVSSGAVNTKFTSVDVPVVCYERLLFDELGMTGSNSGSDYGEDSNELTIDIDNAGHQMTAGLNGEPQVYHDDGIIVWGNPNGNAINIASTQGNYNDQWAVFGYETGSTMVNGTAPARRASLFFKASQVSKLNANGWALFDAVICWATGCQNARFAPQINQVPPVKAYPNPFPNQLVIEWENHAQEVQLIMRNLLGQEVLSQRVMLQGRYQLSTANLPRGLYILQVIGNNFRQELKVVKE